MPLYVGNTLITDNTKLPLAGGTMTGIIINNSVATDKPILKSNNGGSWINGIKGQSAYYNNSTDSDSLKCLASLPTTNGRIIIGTVGTNLHAGYMNKTTISAGTNTMTKNNILCDESGNMKASGNLYENSNRRIVHTSATASETIYEARVMSKTSADSGWANIPNNTVIFCY